MSQEAEDVVDACADALLSACALALILEGREPTIDASLVMTAEAMKRIIDRTLREGGRER